MTAFATAAPPGTPRDRRGKRLSVVIPMHDESVVLATLFERLDAVAPVLGVDLEIICVDDGSNDDTLERLRIRAASDPRVRVVALTRNFGKEAALTAGMDVASGDLLVPLDADLQDPPELIAEFLTLWEQGYDVVYGVRIDRSADTRTKRVTAEMFYRVFNFIADRPIPPSTGDFRLMDREVVEALKQLPERNRFMKGLFSWVGFRQVGVPYVRPERAAGQTSLRYANLFRLALDGITAFTTLPLRVWSLIGATTALIAILYALVIVFRVLLLGIDVPGYASLMVVLLFGFALQMVALGVMGEYIGRLYEEAKARPIYLVRTKFGFGDARGS